MNTPAKARQTLYFLGAALGALATVAAVMGWGTYDAETGIFDLGPVHIPTLVMWIGNVVAALALWRKWPT